MPVHPDPSSGRARSARPSRAAPLVVLVAFTATAAAGGATVYRIGRDDLRARRAGELAGIAVQKAEQVARWREERLTDALVLSRDPALVAALAASPRAPAVRESLAAHLEELRGIGDYTAIAVTDAAGSIRATAGEFGSDLAWTAPLLAGAAEGGDAEMSDVHDPRAPRVDVVAPIAGEAGAGAVLLSIDPRPTLFRMVEFWHEPGSTAEALLVRSADDGPSILNAPERRADAGGAPAPLQDAILPGLRLRRAGTFRGEDARGGVAIGASAPVARTGWSVVVREDEAETLAPLRERALAIGVSVLALVVAAAAGVGSWTSRQARRFERERAVAEAQRGALAGRLERLSTYVQDMLFVADDQQRIVEANDRAVQLLGYPREELVGMPVRELRDPATLADYPDRVRQQAEHGAALFETRYRRKDGTTFPVQVSVHTEAWGGQSHFEAIARDLSAVKQAEQALRDGEAKFRAAFEHAPLGLALVGPDARIFETNRALHELTGYPEDALRGLALDALDVPATDAPAEARPHERLLRGEVDRLETPRRVRRRDGTLGDAIVRASVLRDERGAPRLLVALFEDVSAKKRIEAQLLLADRMASIGTLAAGVAHEINNPLAFILSNLEFALGELAEAGADDEVQRALQEAKDGAIRVREIVRDLKTFSRPGGETRHAVDVRAVLSSAVGLASNEIRHRARLVVDPGDVPPVVVDEHRLAQVFVNLLVNAAQAIPPGDVAGNVVRAATSTAPDGGAIVEISDTGQGIAPEVLPRIFDPFFTTKPVGVGTGLGLSICHGIVSALGGDVRVESVVGKGSTFRVHLPAAARAGAALPEADGAPCAAVPGAPRRRILVVDDEPLVVRAVTRSLDASHDVVALTSARAALERVTSGEERFDALLCDLMMPEMSGMELFDRLVALAPALAARTVFLTGGAFTEPARAFLERVPNARLEKPFEPRALRELVARVLAPERPGAALP